MRRIGTAWVAVLALTVGCDGSSPTEPTPQAPSVSIVFETSALDAHRAQITQLLHHAVEVADGPLRVANVRFAVGLDPYLVVPGWGMGGAAHGPEQISIVVDPNYPGLEQLLVERLPPIAGHEIHHVVRWRGVGPPQTLLEAMVFEGLADHFSVEHFGTDVPPWANALSEAQIATLWARALLELDAPSFDHPAWFFGLGGTDLPRWTGYTLGYRLVGDYLARHPGTSAAGLVHASAELFRPPT